MMMTWSAPVLAKSDAIGNGSTLAWSCAQSASINTLLSKSTLSENHNRLVDFSSALTYPSTRSNTIYERSA